MTALLLDPHGDDAVLFACYTLLREKPHVLVVNRTVPSEEITKAMEVVGCSWSTGDVFWEREDLFVAPAWETGGHDQHNRVAAFAADFYKTPRISYLTYAPRGQRSTWGSEVVPTAKEIALKLRALACFESQIEQPSTRPWFFELLDLREWVSA